MLTPTPHLSIDTNVRGASQPLGRWRGKKDISRGLLVLWTLAHAANPVRELTIQARAAQSVTAQIVAPKCVIAPNRFKLSDQS